MASLKDWHSAYTDGHKLSKVMPYHNETTTLRNTVFGELLLLFYNWMSDYLNVFCYILIYTITQLKLIWDEFHHMAFIHVFIHVSFMGECSWYIMWLSDLQDFVIWWLHSWWIKAYENVAPIWSVCVPVCCWLCNIDFTSCFLESLCKQQPAQFATFNKLRVLLWRLNCALLESVLLYKSQGVDAG